MKRILLFGCLAATTAHAQEKNDSTDLAPVEVRALRAAPTAPFAKTNLSRKDIERQNLGRDLPFLIAQTPSVVANSDAGNGVGYTGFRVRGTDPTRVNLTINGIPYNDAESNGTFLVNLPDFASSVGSIQIQRGVGTSTNGAGAFGASVNLSTNEVNRAAYAEINNAYGSFNTRKHTVKVGSGLVGNHFTLDARASQIASDGFIDRASSNLRSAYLSTAYLSEKTDVRFNIFSGKERTYQAWYGIAESDRKGNRQVNYAGTERPGEPYDNETDNYTQDHYQLFLTRRFNPRLTLSLAGFRTNGRGYYEQYKAEEDYAKYGLPYPVRGVDTTFTSDFVRQLWLDNSFYGTVNSLQYCGKKTELTFGLSATRYNGDHFGEVIWASKILTRSGNWYRNDARKDDLAFFGKWQQRLTERLQIFTDLQYRGVGYDLNGFRNNPDLVFRNRFRFFNPKFGLSYSVKDGLLYASYSVANKEPNRDDFEAGIDQQPRSEQLFDWEAGAEQKKARWSWSANVYYMKYRDQLVLTGKINDVGAYTRTNIPHSFRLGLELQGGYVLNKWARASCNLTLSRNRVQHFTEYIDDYDNGGQQQHTYRSADISFSPSVTGAATVTLSPVKGVEVDLLHKYVSRQYLDNTGNRSRSLDPFFVQDLRMLYSLNKGLLKNATLIVQVYNVLDTRYEPNGYTFSYYANQTLTTENYYFPMAGRNYMVGVNLRF